MRTFFLLITIVFLTTQVQAQKNEEEMLTQEEAMAENQVPELPSMEADDSDTMASAPQQRKTIVCYCRRICNVGELVSGTCRLSGVYYQLCCR